MVELTKIMNLKTKFQLETAKDIINDLIINLVDIPDSLLVNNLTCEKIFFRTKDATIIINKLNVIEIISLEEIEKIRLDYDIMISKILNLTDDRFIISDTLKYLQNKISTALEYAINYQYYELAQNIKNFENYYDLYLNNII